MSTEMTTLAGDTVLAGEKVRDVIFADPQFLANPWPDLQRLQAEAPVFWSDDRQGWLITRHGDVKAAYADKRFSAARVDQFFRGLPSDVVSELESIRKYYTANLSRMDGPDHIRVRTLMMKAFNRSSANAVQSYVGEVVDGIMDRCEQEREFDFTKVVGSVLPTSVIQKLLGLPEEYKEELFDLATHIALAIAANDPTPELMLRMEHATRSLNEIFSRLILERQSEPGEDLISSLTHARDGLQRLSEDELLACFHSIIVGGTETTSHSLGVGLVELIRRPELQEQLRADPSCAYKLATELLRYPGTVKCRTRIAAEDIELNGELLRKGDLIWLMNAAANVDTTVFKDPFEIEIDRDNRESMAFAPGLHFCVGYHLATMEIAEFLKRFVARFNVEIVNDKLEMVSSYVFYGYKSLRLRVTPR